MLFGICYFKYHNISKIFSLSCHLINSKFHILKINYRFGCKLLYLKTDICFLPKSM